MYVFWIQRCERFFFFWFGQSIRGQYLWNFLIRIHKHTHSLYTACWTSYILSTCTNNDIYYEILVFLLFFFCLGRTIQKIIHSFHRFILSENENKKKYTHIFTQFRFLAFRLRVVTGKMFRYDINYRWRSQFDFIIIVIPFILKSIFIRFHVGK